MNERRFLLFDRLSRLACKLYALPRPRPATDACLQAQRIPRPLSYPHQDSRRRKEHCCFKAGEDKPRRTKQPDTLNALLDTPETTMNTLITSTNLSRLISTAILGAITLSWGAMSIAADESEAPQAVVKFGDLNLSNPQGAAALYSRITLAAYEVCKSFDIDSRNLGSRARVDACVHKAIADAVTKVDRAELFAVYSAKNHQARPIIVAAAQTR